MPLQWRNQIWQSLEEGAGKRCSECEGDCDRQGEGEKPPDLKNATTSKYAALVVVKVDCTPLPTEAQRQMSQEGIESVAMSGQVCLQIL